VITTKEQLAAAAVNAFVDSDPTTAQHLGDRAQVDRRWIPRPTRPTKVAVCRNLRRRRSSEHSRISIPASSSR